MENTNKMLKVVYGDATLGIHGNQFSYIFSYQRGGLESLVINKKEWIYRTPAPTFWRALTDNDRGNHFHYRSGIWLSADMFLPCKAIECFVNDKKIPLPVAPYNNCYNGAVFADCIKLSFIYETITVPSTEVIVDYIINTSGKIRMNVHFKGRKGLPELPAFGIRFIMPTKASGYKYEGLSGETYPDRKAGAENGIFQTEGLPVTPYLVPQECGMHVDTKWVTVYRNNSLNNVKSDTVPEGLRFTSINGTFGFSCLPFTSEELENALHQEELPQERRTVLCIMGAVRGVGGIDSWGAEPEEAYRISAEKDISFSFDIQREDTQ